MLSGYYTKSSGHVTLDKDAIGHAELRQMVTYVPQQTYVFTGTILEKSAIRDLKEKLTSKKAP